jgi:hypothetical protein
VLIVAYLAIVTDLIRGMDEAGLKSLNQGNFDWKSIDEGAATLIVAGFDPGLNGKLPSFIFVTAWKNQETG